MDEARLFENISIIGLKIYTKIIILILGASLPFITSLTGEFVFDDTPAIVKNNDVISDVPITVLFSHDFWGTPANSSISHKSYRPLTVLMFRFIRNFSGQLDPFPFHVVNIALHVIDTLLAYIIYTIIFDKSMQHAAFISALIFAVHPIHTECVAGIVGQAELLSALFAFCSFISYHFACVYSRSIWLTISITIASCSFGIIAMLCKEQGIAMLGVCLAYDVLVFNTDFLAAVLDWRFCLDETRIRNNHIIYSSWQRISIKMKELVYSYGSLIMRLLILCMFSIISLVFRWKVMGFQLPTFLSVDNPASHVEPLMNRVLNYNYIYTMNVGIVLFPKWLCFDWSMGCIPLLKTDDLQNLDPRILLIVLFWAVLLLLISKCILTDNVAYRRCLTMGLLFTIISFIPASNILFAVGFVIAERVLYLPSLGFFMIIGIGIFKMLKRMPRVSEYIFLAVLVILCVRTIERSGQWQNEKLLYESGLSVCPENAKVHFNIGKISADSKNSEKAIKHYQEALRLRPDYEQALNNYANLVKEKGDLTKAEETLEKAIELKGDFAAAWMNLGIASVALKKYEKGLKCYTKALEIRQNYPDCHYNLGNLFMELGQHQNAIIYWTNAIELNPEHAPAWCNLIIMLDDLGEYVVAEELGREAISVLPNEACIIFNFAILLAKMQKYADAEYYFSRTIKLKPGIPIHHINFAISYHRAGKYCEAYEQYKLALRLKPDSKSAKKHRKSMMESARGCPDVTKYDTV